VSPPAVSGGPVARFEDDHGSLGRPSAGVRVDLRIDRDPALPQQITLPPKRGERAPGADAGRPVERRRRDVRRG
jgi:hypothetical protein